MLDRVLSAVDENKGPSLEGLKEFLRIPSISTNPANKQDVARCADWLAEQLRGVGLTPTIHPTAGHPVILAKNEHRADRATVLFYGHYDVQPPEPLELWTSPAFEPTVRKTEANTDAVYARGAVDDKGQVWCHVEAMRAWQKQGWAPVNVIFLIEGEEEVGSEHLGAFVEAHQDELKADIAIVSDTDQFARGHPAITYGLRGLVYEEVNVTGPNRDLHSGMYGGAVPNPANVLCKILASLHDEEGRVDIPGFYNDVVALTKEERALWARLPFSEQEFARDLDIAFPSGEPGFTSPERKWARPTCDINGMTYGYQGPGAKTVIGSWASAKVSMRLVPDQDPLKIQRAFRKVIRERAPRNVKIDFLIDNHGALPVVVPIDTPATQLAAQAVEAGFGNKPTLIRSGGTIPVVALLKKILNLDALLVGFGLPDDRVHSPNEKFDLDALHAGSRTAAALYGKLAELKR